MEPFTVTLPNRILVAKWSAGTIQTFKIYDDDEDYEEGIFPTLSGASFWREKGHM